MENKPNRSIIPSQNNAFTDLTLRLKLIGRLIADCRVNLFLKIIPITALAYLFSPVDLVPNAVLPVVGMLDDAAILWLASYAFLEMVPTDVLKDHLRNLVSNNEIIDQVAHAETEKEDDIIDGDVQELK
ncbi:MAG: YkvA family protein [Anaerolineales bacterium]